MRVLALPDKFRGTATATEVADAIAAAAADLGWDSDRAPIADGGEGLLDCFGGANRDTEVTGPSGAPVTAQWLLDGTRAVIEMALASGQPVAGEDHDPMTATTTGTGELVAAALDAGAIEVIVGAGGSVTTDGGLGALDVLRRYAPLDGTRGYAVRVATDVTTRFRDAAEVFAPQKGADPGQVAALTERLDELAARYRDEFGIDVGAIVGSGAAGGLAGGLAALGASVVPGFDLVANHLDLAAKIAAADLVVTGEGKLDPTSLTGKAVGGVVALCREVGRPVAVVAGQVADGTSVDGADVVDLTARFGDRAQRDTAACVREAVTDLLGRARGTGSN